MKRTKVVDAFDASLYGTKVNVKGWVRTRRGNKNVNFIAVNDGSPYGAMLKKVYNYIGKYGNNEKNQSRRCI